MSSLDFGPSVLLAREAALRWRKGWASGLLLGLAYGIVNEGLAAGTLFNPNAAATVASGLAEYGRFAGVSWVWAVRIDIVHTLWSALPPPTCRLPPSSNGARQPSAGAGAPSEPTSGRTGHPPATSWREHPSMAERAR